MTVDSAMSVTESTNTNTIKLDTKTDSKISHVSVYGSRAEIVRIFKFDAAAGHNVVDIEELPEIVPNSLR